MRKVKFNIKETNRMNKNQNGLPFVMKYHLLLNALYSIIRKILYLLNMDQKVKELFHSKPTVSFRNARKLSKTLSFGKKGGFIQILL